MAAAYDAAGLTAVNIAIAWKMTSVQGYHAIMSMVTIPLWILSGALFPVRESALGIVMRLNPVTYMVSSTRLSLGGNDAWSLAASVGITTAFALLTFGLAVRTCRRRR